MSYSAATVNANQEKIISIPTVKFSLKMDLTQLAVGQDRRYPIHE